MKTPEQKKLNNANEALLKLKQLTPLHNTNPSDHYCRELILWGLGEVKKPNPKDYGLEGV